MAKRKRNRNKAEPAPAVDQRQSALFSKGAVYVAAVIAGIFILALGLLVQFAPALFKTTRGPTADKASVAIFVGSEACAGCHQTEAKLWGGSQHQQAMDHATEQSVLGDFHDASFDYYGTQSRFFRKDGKFLVETDGPDGKLGEFEVKYTFGVFPLQQYLIEFADGRVQALSIAWDSRSREDGGQRWMHLYPNEQIRHDDVLHWTKLNQNWNFMCADCHSTGVRKNYDAAKDTFATTFAEISVGCEACHGAGSNHVSWARERQQWWPFGKTDDPGMGLAERFSERRDATWVHNPATGNVVRSNVPRTLRAEVETCGLCHARRGGFSEAWVPGKWLSETHMVAPIVRGQYQPDGQMIDEVYNYASFKQSKMFAAGVTCSDCHDPHSAKPKADGDGVCLQCHAPDKFAVAAHNRHEAANPAPGCASCHMPVRTYMTVDPRHDHSFRVPRPDLSVKFGTPNACTDCHAGKSAEWAAAAVEGWHGPDRKGFQIFTAAFHAAWNNQPSAAALLAAVAADPKTPAIVRGSALRELASRVGPQNLAVAAKGLADPDPEVRIGALDMIENVPLQQRWPLASRLLQDPTRGVRIRAASTLADVELGGLSGEERRRFELAADEFVAAQKFNADRPEARATLGTFYIRRGQAAEAEAEYLAALRLSPQFTGALVNLVDLYRATGRDREGEAALRKAIAAAPNDSGLHHVLGLTLVRLSRLDEAVAQLRQAADLEPDNARYAYVYGVALHSSGHGAEAIAYLKEVQARQPENRDILLALIGFSRDAGDTQTALQYAAKLSRIVPNDPTVMKLLDDIRRAPTAPQ